MSNLNTSKAFVQGLASIGNLSSMGDSIGFNKRLVDAYSLSTTCSDTSNVDKQYIMAFTKDVIERECLIEAIVKREVLTPIS